MPNLGIFLWRLRALSVASQPAWADPANGRYRRFSPLGADLELFAAPEPESEISHLAGPDNVPLPITRRRLHEDLNRTDRAPKLYGPAGSLQLISGGQPVPPSEVMAADLSDDPANPGQWAHHPANHYAVDPVLGRITAPAGSPVPARLEVTYRFGAPSGIGTVLAASALPALPPGAVTTRVPEQHGLRAALRQTTAMAEVLIQDHAAYGPVPRLHAHAGQFVALRAAAGKRPRLLRRRSWRITGDPDSEILLEGLVITDAALSVPRNYGAGQKPNGLRRLHLRGCTLVPGLALKGDGSPRQPGAPALVVEVPGLLVIIEDCILGGLRVDPDARVQLRSSIVDANDATAVAYAGLNGEAPGGTLSAESCTFIGRVHATVLSWWRTRSSSAVSRKEQAGRVSPQAWGRARLCAPSAAKWAVSATRSCRGGRVRRAACRPANKAESLWLWPRFTSLRYGNAGYAQLSSRNPAAIWRGACDGACIGAPARAVAQFQWQLPHGQVAPLPLFADVVNLQASLSADPAAQEPLAEPVDVHQHALSGLFHLGHGVGFQTQLFSDKGLYEHLGRFLSYSLVGNYEINPMRGALQTLANPQAKAVKGLQRPITLSGEEPKKQDTKLPAQIGTITIPENAVTQ